MSDENDWRDYFRDINKEHEKKDDEFKRMVNDIPHKDVKEGDRVLINAHMLGRGHPWIRVECYVAKVAGDSIKIEGYSDITRKHWNEWIHRALVIEILKRD